MGPELQAKQKDILSKIAKEFETNYPGLKVRWYYNPEQNTISYSFEYRGQYAKVDITSWLFTMSEYDYYIVEELKKGLKGKFGDEFK